MDSTKVLARLDELLKQFAFDQAWGSITIEFRGGAPCYIESRVTEKVVTQAAYNGVNPKEAIAHGREYRSQR